FLLQPPPTPTLFPYTTLFRSERTDEDQHRKHVFDESVDVAQGHAQERLWPEHPKVECGIKASSPQHQRAQQQHEEAEEDQLVCKDRKSTRLNSSHVKISYAVF